MEFSDTEWALLQSQLWDWWVEGPGNAGDDEPLEFGDD